jgi:PAS domain S-box-containing protein
MVRPDGTSWDILISGAPVRDESGQVVGAVSMFTDITRRKQAEDALGEQKALLQSERDLLQTVMENTRGHLAYLDPDFNFVMVNSTYARGCGHTVAELIGKNHFDLFPNEDNQVIFEKVRDTGEPVQYLAKPFEFVDQPERGVTYWDWTLVPVKDASRRVQGLVLSLMDVTEQKRAEEELREHREDLNRAQAVARTGSWRLDVRRNELRWSDETYRMFGIPQGAPLTYESFLATIHPDDREYVDREWTAAMSGQPCDIEHRIVVGDTIKWVRERAELEFDSDGMLVGGFGTVQDVTERRQIQEAVDREHRRLQTLVDTSPVGIVLVDASRRLVLVNREAQRLVGAPVAGGARPQPRRERESRAFQHPPRRRSRHSRRSGRRTCLRRRRRDCRRHRRPAGHHSPGGTGQAAP